jgi:hypothetical protein
LASVPVSLEATTLAPCRIKDRADFVPGQSLNVRRGSDFQWTKDYFNINAFQVNAPGTFGNTPKNFILGPLTAVG